jgi:glycosyltransferase involved in cell wall biosynthesis
MTGSVTKRIRSPLIDWALKLARGAGGPAAARNDIHRSRPRLDDAAESKSEVMFFPKRKRDHEGAKGAGARRRSTLSQSSNRGRGKVKVVILAGGMGARIGRNVGATETDDRYIARQDGSRRPVAIGPRTVARVGVSAMNSDPTVSVVLSVRNGGKDLPTAIGTILNQTFSDFELIAINNGSTDETGPYLDSITDPRVRVFHQEDKGLARALNRGISLARGRYIARQDHDDLADPSRIAKQVEFLDARPDHALIGTRAEIWIGDTPTDRFHDHPTEDADLRFALLFNNYFVHSSVMMRKAALDKVGVYTTDRSRQPPEDYELWSRIARRFRVANLPERLTIYREVPTSMSRDGKDPFKEKLVLISAENLAAATVGEPKPQRIHLDIANLLHGAPEKISQSADIDAMCDVITEAGRTIFGNRNIGGEDDPVAVWNRNLQHHFNIQKYRLDAGRMVVGRVKGALRRLGFSI